VKPRTWMFELGVVAVVELVVAIASGSPIELLGATAVALSFAHGQVADRLAEAEAMRAATTFVPGGSFSIGYTEHAGRLTANQVAIVPSLVADPQRAIVVECYRWARRYFVTKELFWCAYFALRGSWSALAGVGLFLLYPLWRRWWRKRRRSGIVR
jgi:hypothetical protein